MAHEVQLHAVHVETLDDLLDDGQPVRAHFGEGKVETRLDAPLDGPLRYRLARPADHQLRALPAEPAVPRVVRVHVVVAVHPHPRKEREAGAAALARQDRHGAAVLGDEGADVLGDARHDAGGGGVHERAHPVVERGAALAEYLAPPGLVLVDLVVSQAPPESAAHARVPVDHLGLQVCRRHGGLGRAQDPTVVGEYDCRCSPLAHAIPPHDAADNIIARRGAEQ